MLVYLQRLANALVVQERHAEALQLLDQALALYTGAAGARSKAAAEALTHYARALANLGMEHLAMPHAGGYTYLGRMLTYGCNCQ